MSPSLRCIAVTGFVCAKVSGSNVVGFVEEVIMGFATAPGNIALQRIPSSRNRKAVFLVTPSKPCCDAV